MKKFPILFEVVEIIQYLKKLKTKEEKKEYLLFLKEELSDICFYYTDDGIEKYLEEHKLTDKYKPEKYNQFVDFDRTHISKSKYRRFLGDLEKILDYIQDQMVDNYLEELRKEKKIGKDYKTFNYNLKQVLEYSNELGDDKLNYFIWIIERYYNDKLENIKKGTPKPDKYGKYQSPKTEIFNTEFFKEIMTRIDILKGNLNIKAYKSMNDFAKDIKKIKYEELSKENKDLFKFDFKKIKVHANKIKDLNERLLYLEWVKKEEAQNRVNVTMDFFEVTFENKINAEIEYVKKEIEIRNSEKLINEMKTQPSTKAKNRIKWKLQITDLIDFLELLYHHNIITKETHSNMNVVIRDCFTDENGKDFDNKNIAKTKSAKGTGKSINSEKLDNIIMRFNKKREGKKEKNE